MKNQRVRLACLSSRLLLLACLSVATLGFSGCVSTASSEQWHCVDASSKPLAGVVALDMIRSSTASDWTIGYVGEGSFAISGNDGSLNFPAKFVSKPSVIEGAPRREIIFLCSEPLHVTYVRGMTTGVIMFPLVRIEDHNNLGFLHDFSNQSLGWYDSVKKLIYVNDQIKAPPAAGINVYRPLADVLPPILRREREAFLKKYGSARPDLSVESIKQDVETYALKHGVPPADVTFAMLLAEWQP